MQFYIAQGIGFIGMILMFISFQQNDKRKILWIQASTALIFSVHFLFLGAFTGVGVNLVAIPRNLIFARKHKNYWQQIILTVIFIAAFIILSIIVWENLLSLFPIVAMSISTIVFNLQTPRNIRFCSLPVSSLWIIYNISTLSIAGFITETFCLLSILIAIFRFDIFKNKTINK